MAYEYTTRNGHRVQVDVAAQFDKVAAEFFAETGFRLHITSGARFWDEQMYFFNGWVNRLPGFNLALHPSSPLAYHVVTNPSGPRAIDVADSGSDPGVTTIGTHRSNVLVRIMRKHGFANDGHYFTPREGWHYRYTGALTNRGAGASLGGSSRNITNRPTIDVQKAVGADADGIWGPQTEGKVKDFQRAWGLDVDGIWGPQSDAVAFLVADGDWGDATTRRVQKAFGVKIDGDMGPASWSAVQKHIGADVDGMAAPQTIEYLQRALNKTLDAGLDTDGALGPKTVTALQRYLIRGGILLADPPKVEQGTPPTGSSEAAATPVMVTPPAADFPAWIRYEEKLKPLKSTRNLDAQTYYGVRYDPIESHTHWWNEPGKGGTHDGNVGYLSKGDVEANYVTSAGRITLTVPLNKIAYTTGRRNPFAWKSENDPLITTSASDLGYKTLGYLHYIVEKRNPKLRGQPIRLHLEFMATGCSKINPARVRFYADAFHTGALDPATGEAPKGAPAPLPPDVPIMPAPDTVQVERSWLQELLAKLGALLGASS